MKKTISSGNVRLLFSNNKLLNGSNDSLYANQSLKKNLNFDTKTLVPRSLKSEPLQVDIPEKKFQSLNFVKLVNQNPDYE